MAEFGENVRRLREAKGMTQQLLADQLFVTRQAVSRWEGGSRYPDLMTAKKLASILDASLEDMLADEDVKRYPEKAPVLESPVVRGAQTATLAFGLAGYLVMLLWYLPGLPEGVASGAGMGLVNILKTVLMTGLFGFGTLVSIREKLTPKIAAWMAMVYFASEAVVSMITAVQAQRLIPNGIIAAAAVLSGVWISWYFLRGKTVSPIPVYVLCAWCGIQEIAGMIVRIQIISAGTENFYNGLFYLSSIVNILARMATLGLFCLMARVLSRKRRQARAGVAQQA